LGTGSRWFGYLQSLPRDADAAKIALFWGANELQQFDTRVGGDHLAASNLGLEGGTPITEITDGKLAMAWAAGTTIEQDTRGEDGIYLLEDVRSYWNAIAEPVLSQLSQSSDLECWASLKRKTYSMAGFLHAYALVSSRAFMVDAYHGLAMVPIADA